VAEVNLGHMKIVVQDLTLHACVILVCMERIYLDYAAATPIDERAKAEILKYFSQEDGLFGNPGSLHSFGQAAHRALENARTTIAKELNAHHSEMLFFSSATEANNFALRAVAKKYKQTTGKTPHIIISNIEHPSVSETVQDMEVWGDAEVSVVPPGKVGESIKENTALVSVIYVQNETGTVQDLKRIREIIDTEARLRNTEVRPSQTKAKPPRQICPLLHTDAAQGYLLSYDVQKLGVDLMTIASYKVYGPKGAAALYIRGEHTDVRDIVMPLMTGGSQEKSMRGGTQNIPAIMGFAKAMELLGMHRNEECNRLAELSSQFIEGVKKGVPNVVLQGGEPYPASASRSPHIINLFFPDSENFDKALDMAGVAASAGSACLQRTAEKSTIVPEGSIRFSLGRYTTKEDIDEAVRRIILSYRKL